VRHRDTMPLSGDKGKVFEVIPQERNARGIAAVQAVPRLRSVALIFAVSSHVNQPAIHAKPHAISICSPTSGECISSGSHRALAHTDTRTERDPRMFPPRANRHYVRMIPHGGFRSIERLFLPLLNKKLRGVRITTCREQGGYREYPLADTSRSGEQPLRARNRTISE